MKAGKLKSRVKRVVFASLASMTLAAMEIVGLTALARVQSVVSPSSASQYSTTKAPAAQSLEAMEAAGTKMSFDVASVKLNKSGGPPFSNVPLGPGGRYAPTGGLFMARNIRFPDYLFWAYEVSGSDVANLQAQLPAWAATDRFDIEARVEGNPTKEQMQLMMQSLLADKFKLVVHHQNREGRVFALELVKPGKTGSQLQPHVGESCPMPATTPAAGAICGAGISGMPASAPGRLRLGARDITVDQIARVLPGNPAVTGVDRPVLDRTGLSGSFDFTLEFTPDFPQGAGPPNFTPDETGPTFMEALQDQLGLKLERTTGPIDVLVVDHVERLSPD